MHARDTTRNLVCFENSLWLLNHKNSGEAQSYESSNESESTSESHSSDEAGGEVVEESEKSESDRHSTSSVEEAQFEVVGVGSDSDDSISF